jgi:misacylated tRNA(Ala) deacylase
MEGLDVGQPACGSTLCLMAIYLCHEQPDLYDHTASVVDARPGAVALSRSAFHPGGGGQVSDIGMITAKSGPVAVSRIEVDGDTWWHVLNDESALVDGDVAVRVDAEHRLRVASLHTMSHVLNAFVFDEFEGSLVTGAQINGDGTGRMDFDLSQIDNDRLRALEAPVNEVIERGLAVEAIYVDAAEAAATEGLVRSLSVAPPPTDDGRLRLIDVAGLDRQACGGTHLSNTAESRQFKIGKIENKGKRNRRVRFTLGA